MDERLDGRRQPKRIAIVGVSGAGKSRLARRVAGLLGLGHIELDRLYWRAGHDASCRHRFKELVGDALAGDRWICDGNYLGLWGLIAARAELVVWLDPPVWLVVLRQLRRAALERRADEPWRLGLGELVLSPWRAHRVAPRRIRKARAVLDPALATTPHLVRVRTSRELRHLVATLTMDNTSTPISLTDCVSPGTHTL